MRSSVPKAIAPRAYPRGKDIRQLFERHAGQYASIHPFAKDPTPLSGSARS